MGIIRLIKPGLFVYECLKIFVLAAFILFQPVDPAGFPRLIFIAPGALFPLMALFIWLDISRYRAYLSLFTAGKCIGIITLLGWLLFSGRFIMAGGYSGIVVIELFLLCGDLLAMAGIILIIKSINKESTETHALEEK